MKYSRFCAVLAVLMMTALPIRAEESPAPAPDAAANTEVPAEQPAAPSAATEGVAPDTTGIADTVLDGHELRAEIPTPEEVVKSAKALAAQAKPVAGNVVAVLESAGRFKTMAKLLKISGLGPMLQTQGSYTLFAPSDKAFTKEQVKKLQKSANRSELVQLLASHIVGGQRLPTSALKQMQQSPLTMAGQVLTLANAEGKQQVNGIEIIGKSIPCSNGVIHVIERTLRPLSGKSDITQVSDKTETQPEKEFAAEAEAKSNK